MSTDNDFNKIRMFIKSKIAYFVDYGNFCDLVDFWKCNLNLLIM